MMRVLGARQTTCKMLKASRIHRKIKKIKSRTRQVRRAKGRTTWRRRQRNQVNLNFNLIKTSQILKIKSLPLETTELRSRGTLFCKPEHTCHRDRKTWSKRRPARLKQQQIYSCRAANFFQPRKPLKAWFFLKICLRSIKKASMISTGGFRGSRRWSTGLRRSWMIEGSSTERPVRY